MYDENTKSGGFSFIINDIINKNNITYSRLKSLALLKNKYLFMTERDSIKDLKIDDVNLLYSLKNYKQNLDKLCFYKKTPLRISLFGGGTDFPQWYKNNEGLLISTTIDKYCYVLLKLFHHTFILIG